MTSPLPSGQPDPRHVEMQPTGVPTSGSGGASAPQTGRMVTGQTVTQAVGGKAAPSAEKTRSLIERLFDFLASFLGSSSAAKEIIQSPEVKAKLNNPQGVIDAVKKKVTESLNSPEDRAKLQQFFNQIQSDSDGEYARDLQNKYLQENADHLLALSEQQIEDAAAQGGTFVQMPDETEPPKK